MLKNISFKIKGMLRDLSVSAFNPEYAYENKNIRIMPTNESTLLSIINEKGTKKTYIDGIGDSIKGIPIGLALVNNELVLFTCGDKSELKLLIIANDSEVNDIDFLEKTIDVDSIFDDRIYKIWIDNNKIKGTRLFRGDLNFNYKHPIESISFYENTDLRKVYWTDGLNLPRVINIAAALSVINKWNTDTFNFVRAISLKEKITIKKNTLASGSFAPGVIQYAFTYFDKYGLETNIFYTSPLYYISYDNRGASPEDKVGNSFTININNVDHRFDYLRVYSIQRTSIDAVAIVKRVADLAITSSSKNISSLTTYTCIATENDIKVLDNGEYADDDGYSPIYKYEPIKLGDTKIWMFNANYDILEIILPDKSIYWNNGLLGELITIKVTKTITTISIENAEFSVYTSANYSLTYTDIGTEGDSVDPTELLYKGGENITFSTMTLKDNTMFMGDIKLSNNYLTYLYTYPFKNLTINFTNTTKKLYSPEINGFYPYYNLLELNSTQIKTFKYLEWYRFGVLLLHYTGRWSEPIWVNDALNIVSVDNVFYNDGYIGLPSAYATFNMGTWIANNLVSLGYVKIRPIIVYPTLQERECICLGILCPTVYNVLDRYSNTPFALSSWFVRPNAPFDIDKSYYIDGFKINSLGLNTYDLQILHGDWTNFIDSHTDGIYSRAGVLNNTHKVWNIFEGTEINNDIKADNVNYGAWAEFRHNHPIPDNIYRNAEILCISNPPLNVDISTETYPTEADVNLWVSQNSENYYIDLSIITLHSPDIEFNDALLNIDTSLLKLRIIGIVPITAFASDIDIQTSTPVNNFTDSLEIPIGFYKEFVGVNTKFSTNTKPNDAHFGWRSLISAPFWFDLMTKPNNENVKNALTSFVVYPWHRNGSLNNSKFKPENGERSAMLDKKRMSNIRYSYKSIYLPISKIWKASYTDLDGIEEGGISGVLIFSSNEVSLVKLPAPKNSGLSDIIYYGNIDKLLSMPLIGDKKKGYPIVISAIEKSEDMSDTGTLHSMFRSNYEPFTEFASNECTGIDPVRIKYKSTPHAVMALNYDEHGWQRILPTIKDGNISDPDNKWSVNSGNKNYANSKQFWDKTSSIGGVDLTIIDIDINGPINKLLNIQHGWLWLGELYNDNILNRFGGTTQEAFENNLWIPCGEPVSLFDEFGAIKSSVTVEWTEGDTYYLRYDHIKTYPFTLEDLNQMTDIVSFMCETRVNIDGRFDRNRGLISNLAITPANFNQVNDVYSLNNNFFNYRGININKLNLTKFNNVISWSKTKTVGELTDTWTNVTLASSLDLDGDKGDIRALRRFNNNIYAFLDRGISQILYNETMLVSTTEGVPLEIANSGKVNGKRYITDKIGCTNKWSICETPSGLYFIDDITKGIFVFNGLLANVSDKYGFHSWINATSKDINIWNPVDFDGFVSYYDKVNGDIFFINKDLCLAFSEPLEQFTSFYSYENTPYFINLEDIGIFTKMLDKHNTALWLHNEGDYNMFFDEYKPFYTTVIANPDMLADKIFNNLEFRADSWNNENLLNTTFDTLEVWNEYLRGTTHLTNIPNRPSSLKKKFRIWKANIPRDNKNRMDRMRNPWLYIKLSMENENINKTLLHDMIVHYFE